MSIEALNWARRIGALGVLRPAEILLLWQLADSANQRDWMCWPSQKTLARETNQSLRTVSTQIGRLKSWGLIRVEDRRGSGGGRIGLAYYLVESALDRLQQELSTSEDHPARAQGTGSDSSSDEPVDDLDANIACRTSAQHANLASRTENERHANSASRTTVRDANTAFESPKRKMASNPNANSGDSYQVPLKDRARINHHHQSSDARVDVIPNEDDNDDFRYMGVEVKEVFGYFPDLDQYLDARSVGEVIDTVLGRARNRVANPTAYVIRALEKDFYGLVLGYKPVPSEVARTPQFTGHDVMLEQLGTHPPSQGQSSGIPAWEALPVDAEPCVNPDHWDGLAPAQFANCPQCRIERRLGEQPRHVRSLSDEDIDRLPLSIQQWAIQARENTTAP